MLGEIDNLDILSILNRVADDEASGGKLQQKVRNIAFIVRQDLGAELLRTICQAPFPIRVTPQALEEQSSQRLQFTKAIIREETRLKIPCARQKVLSELKSA